MNTKTISEIAQHGKKARGKKELIRHLEGGKLTIRQAVLARCYDCTGFFADGKVDCKMPICLFILLWSTMQIELRKVSLGILAKIRRQRCKRHGGNNAFICSGECQLKTASNLK